MFRSALFLIYAVISSIIIFALFFWTLFLGKRGIFFGVYLWSRNIILAAHYILGIQYEIKGNIPPYPAVYASMHQSAWETAFLQTVIKRPVFVLKRELLWIPFFNLFMFSAGYVGVNRKKGAGALKNMVRGVEKAIRKGNSIIIFPEGTRVKPGDVADIKPGVVAVYTMSDVTVIPVSLDSGYLWPRNSFRKKPGKITIIFNTPIHKGLKKEEFISELKRSWSERY